MTIKIGDCVTHEGEQGRVTGIKLNGIEELTLRVNTALGIAFWRASDCEQEGGDVSDSGLERLFKEDRDEWVHVVSHYVEVLWQQARPQRCGETKEAQSRLDDLWQAHKQAQLERGMEKTVFSANTELAQVLADLHVENATLTADNATLQEENERLLGHNDRLVRRIDDRTTRCRAYVATIRGMHATIDMHMADLASLRVKNEALEEELWEERAYCFNKEALKSIVGKERMTIELLRTEKKALEETLAERVADLKMMTGLYRQCMAKNVAAIDHCNAEMCDYNQTSLREVIRILKGDDDG